MSTKTAVITVLLATLLAGGGTLGYILVFNQEDVQTTDQKQAVDPPLESFVNKDQNSGPNLQVQSTGRQNSSDDISLPEPSNFEVYEQYENADSTQYIDIIVGEGEEALSGKTLNVVYQGWLTDGTLFDQSRVNEQGQVVAFPVTLGANQVIQGWEQGLTGMKQGGKRRLIIPSQFGYGASGQDPIPPNSMLIFDVELVRVDSP